MKIEFQSIELENFASYKLKQTLNLNNRMALFSGYNGAGKSMISIAIYYALFGKNPNGKVNDLINYEIGKKLKVILKFKIDKDIYKIIRGIKPNIFEIYKNEELINISSSIKEYQKVLNDIIQFDELIFNQLLYLGANVTNSKNFMELNSKEKEKVFQILMDTTYFNELSQKGKEYKKYLKNEIDNFEILLNNNKNDIILLEKQIEENINHNKIIKEQRETLIKQNNDNINNKLKDNEIIKTKLKEGYELLKEYKKQFNNINDLYNKELETLKDDSKEKVKLLKDNLKQIDNNILELEDKLNAIKINIKNYQKAEKEKIICNKCGNEIKQHFDFNYNKEINKGKQLNNRLKELKKEKDDINNNILKIKNNFIQDKNKLLEKYNINNIESKIKNIEKDINYLNNNLDNNMKYIEKLKNDNNHLDNMKEKKIDYSLLENKKDNIIVLEKNIIQYKEKLNLLDEFIELLSDDNLKGQYIEKYLPLLNYHINLYISKFGLPYNFILDKKFNEKIILNGNDKNILNFGQLSNGQKMRIIVSILFAFLKLTEEKANVSFNLLILDEFINGSLDEEGVEDILKILKYQFTDKDIMLISHNSDIKNSEIFDRTIKIKKTEKGSEIIS